MSTVKPGRYSNAKISNYGIRPDKNGDPRVWVQFKLQDGDNEAFVQWSNNLDPKPISANGKTFNAQQISLENLAKMGFEGGLSNITTLYDGLESNALNLLLDFDLVVEGGFVKYINLPGEGPGKKFESKEALMAALAKTGIVTSVAPSKNYLGD